MRTGIVVAGLACSLLARAEPRQRASFYLEALSTDGKHALLQELVNGGGDLHYHVVAVDGGAIEADVTLPAISKLPLETMTDGGGVKPGVKIQLGTPELAADLRAAVPVLAQFPLGAGNRIAVRGSIVAFNVGDYIYTSKAAVIGKRLSNEASYAPWLTPDGTSIMFRMMNGHFPKSPIGNYELYISPVDGSTPAVRILGTSGALDGFVLGRAGTVRFLANDEGAHQICAIDVTLAKPYVATKKGCLSDGERLVAGTLSTHGEWAAITTTRDATKDRSRFRFRTLDVEHGKPGFDEPRTLLASAINDDGLVVIDRFTATVIVDSHTKVVDQLTKPLHVMSSMFRATTELVAEQDGAVVVFDTHSWKHMPWKDPN